MEEERYQAALHHIMYIIQKLGNWSGTDLSTLDEEYGLFGWEEILQELINKHKGEQQ